MSAMGGAEASVEVERAFIAVGCNRVVGAVSWGPCNLVAFGAHNAVAIFSPEESRILVTLPGHRDLVNCVLWLAASNQLDSDGSIREHFLLSGSSDGAVILWAFSSVENTWRIASQLPKAHERAVTCMAAYMVSPSLALLSSTSSDSFVRIWNVSLPAKPSGDCSISLLQSIPVGSRAMVATSLTALPGSQQTLLLALGGLDNHVHFYVRSLTGEFSLACQVKGHQDWIRALDFSSTSHSTAFDTVFLASSSQDKSIRIWKISRRAAQSKDGEETLEMSLRSFIDGPIFKAGEDIWQVSMESLLLGHEDWVYSVRWRPHGSGVGMEASNATEESMCVLSASMDRSMMIWRPDAASGIWINEVTVGELAPSALGFYGGVWSPQGDAILANGYGGSLHLWKNLNLQAGDWQPQLTPSGHSASVADFAWAKTGQFLISVSHDQTARLFACWNWSNEDKSSRKTSWHEIGRPQVHGHDLNCLAMVRGPGNHRYVSGAEEKVARVFEAPGALLDTLTFTTGGKSDGLNRDDVHILGANMSALGLSQKPIYAPGRGSSGTESAVTTDLGNEGGLDTMGALPDAEPTVLTEPPFEEHLAQNTLWPESHKLYGHGNELFAMCCDHAGKFVATACKAQSETFAQIWLWQVDSWRPAGQLKAHALTVTQLEFSHNDRFLLSVSRDRHLSVFERVQAGNESESSSPYQLVTKIDAHKRIIWTCSWSCCDRFFATGSRDKIVKIWAVRDTETGVQIENVLTLPTFKSSVTALAWGPGLLLAVGMEDGTLELWGGSLQGSMKDSSHVAEDKGTGPSESSGSPEEQSWKLEMACLQKFDRFNCHVAAVHRLAWRDIPIDDEHMPLVIISTPLGDEPYQLASCGADYSIRLFNVKHNRRFTQ
ncbi:unnamed protein product [Calypogeia fissa]